MADEVTSILERSDQVDQMIHGTRDAIKQAENIPQEEKQRLAQGLRLELVIGNAQLTYSLFEHVVDNPNATQDELIEVARNSGQVLNPELVVKFVDVLKNTTLNVNAIKDLILEETNGNLEEFGKWILFGENTVISPGGQIIYNSDFPLALSFTLDHDTFQKVEPRNNVAGTHISLSPVEIKGILLYVPVIFYDKDYYSEQLKHHEETHSKNSVLKDTLTATDQWSLWGSLQNFNCVLENAGRLRENPNNLRYDQLNNTPEYSKVLAYALSRAKDELLAAMGNNQRNAFSHRERILLGEGYFDVYDYFSNHLGITEDTDLYYDLWNEYRQLIYSSTNVALWVDQMYNSPLFTDDSQTPFLLRSKLLPWIMAQVPINDWNKFLKNTLFGEEIRMYTDIHGIFRTLEGNIKPVLNYPQKKEDEALLEEVTRYKEELTILIRENETGSLIPVLTDYLNRYKYRLDELTELTKSTDTFKHNQEISLIQFSLASIESNTRHPLLEGLPLTLEQNQIADLYQEFISDMSKTLSSCGLEDIVDVLAKFQSRSKELNLIYKNSQVSDLIKLRAAIEYTIEQCQFYAKFLKLIEDTQEIDFFKEEDLYEEMKRNLIKNKNKPSEWASIMRISLDKMAKHLEYLRSL